MSVIDCIVDTQAFIALSIKGVLLSAGVTQSTLHPSRIIYTSLFKVLLPGTCLFCMQVMRAVVQTSQWILSEQYLKLNLSSHWRSSPCSLTKNKSINVCMLHYKAARGVIMQYIWLALNKCVLVRYLIITADSGWEAGVLSAQQKLRQFKHSRGLSTEQELRVSVLSKYWESQYWAMKLQVLLKLRCYTKAEFAEKCIVLIYGGKLKHENKDYQPRAKLGDKL